MGAFWACDEKNENHFQYRKPDVTTSTFTDTRDNYTYQCISVNGQTWMAENYRYLPKGASVFGVYSYNQDPPSATTLSTAVVKSALSFFLVKMEIPADIYEEMMNRFNYDNASGMEVLREFYEYVPNVFYETLNGNGVLSPFNEEHYNIYGALYTLDAAKEFAPEGWRLPTDEDWAELEKSLGMPYEEIEKFEQWRGSGFGRALKEGSDGIGFNALYAGMKTSLGTGMPSATTFYNAGSKAYFWSSSIVEPNDSVRYAITRSIYNKNDEILRASSIIKNIAYSVRYIKKAEGEE